MITIEQRIELLRGGYTPEQIEKFDQPEPTAQPAQQAQQEPKQEQEPAVAPAAAPAAAPAQQEPAAAPAQQEQDALQLIRNMLESNKEVSKNMAQLTAAIQANALASSGLPGGSNAATAEDALASIIAPKLKERS